MIKFTIIACIGKNYELGKNGDLIWRIKEDLESFKKYTYGKKIIMGMNTFNSLPKLLPNRTHLVLTRKNIIPEDKVLFFHDIDSILSYLNSLDEEVMIIGGSTIYKEFLKYTNKMILTEVDGSKEADTFFPRFNKEDWNSKIIYSNENPSYKRLIYTRK